MKRSVVIVAAGVLLLTGCTSAPAPAPTVTVYETAPAVSEPTPVETTAETPPPAAPEAVALTDEQRATLDTTFGRDLGENGLLPTYCPMDVGGRGYYADLIASQIDGFTEGMVMQYLAEVC